MVKIKKNLKKSKDNKEEKKKKLELNPKIKTKEKIEETESEESETEESETEESETEESETEESETEESEDETEETESEDEETESEDETEESETEESETEESEDETEESEDETEESEDETEDESEDETEESEDETEENNNMDNKIKNNIIGWVSPDRLIFPHWIGETFGKDYTLKDNDIKMKPGVFKPFLYQKFLKRYLNPVSPYRGVLLYHGLGTGKTCTAIGIAEQFKNDNNIIVMLPASLRGNFIEKGIHFCADKKYKKVKDMYKDFYTFISYNASNTINQIKKVGTFDNKIIIIEEAHNLISLMVGGILDNNTSGRFIYDTLLNCKNSRIIALTGTPIQKDQYELGLLANILRGKFEITRFTIKSKYTKNSEDLKSQLKKLKFIDYIDINIPNDYIELHITKYSYTPEYFGHTKEIEKVCKNNNIEVSYNGIEEILLFPEDPDDFDKMYITMDDKGEKVYDPDIMKKRLMGLISYYELNKKCNPDVLFEKDVYVNMSSYQNMYYDKLREYEKKSERGGGGSTGKRQRGKRVSSTFRVYTRQCSNFAFPRKIKRPFKDKKFVVFGGEKSKGKKKNKKVLSETEIESESDINTDSELEMSDIEEELNNKQKSIEYKNRIKKALSKLEKNKDKYLSLEALNEYSPKMKLILENINKTKGLVLVYSNFRSMEGVGIFSLVLKANGYDEFGSKSSLPKFAIYSGVEDEETRMKTLNVFTDESNKHGERIKIIMTTAAGAEGLDLKNIRQVHIMDPYWYESRTRQVIGRAVRRNSHKDLPENERNVEIYKYLSVFSGTDIDKLKELNEKGVKRPNSLLSTDEYIYFNSNRKQRVIDELLDIMKSSSIDCLLNKKEIDGEYTCLNFGNKFNKDTMAYQPRHSKDYEIKTKKVKVVFTPGFLNIKTGKVYVTDTKNKKIYEFHDFIDKKKTDKTSLIQKNKKLKKVVKIFVDTESEKVYRKSGKDKKTKVMGEVNEKGILKKLT